MANGKGCMGRINAETRLPISEVEVFARRAALRQAGTSTSEIGDRVSATILPMPPLPSALTI
jgi:hypothetical protein